MNFPRKAARRTVFLYHNLCWRPFTALVALETQVDLREVVVGLHKIVPHIPLRSASEAAVRVLLQFDRDHDRQLDFAGK